MRYYWRRIKCSVRELLMFLMLIFRPGFIVGIVIIETIYWTSPKWAQEIGLPTYTGDKVADIARCHELLATTCKTEIVHDNGIPIPPDGLPEWTPMRVERQFESGLTVVSALGPHGNFQYIVRDLNLTKGKTFRIFHGAIILT